MNPGALNCGAYYELTVNQEYDPSKPLTFVLRSLISSITRVARSIVISTESKGVRVEQLRDVSCYSLYIDIAYQDGGYLFGQLLIFPEGTHDLQYKYCYFISAHQDLHSFAGR